MRNCKKCGEYIPWQKKIGGKVRYFGGRKFCIQCSPLGTHNTRRDDPLKAPLKGKPVNGKRPYSQWAEEQKRMHRQRVSKTGTERKAKLVSMSGGKCSRCGYCKSLRSLCFHHRNDKKFALTVKSLKKHSWEEIIVEWSKCDLVCANCHGEIHDEINERTLKQVSREAF